MPASITQSCGWQPDRLYAMKAAGRIAEFLAHSSFAKAKIVARDEIMAYASAVSGLEVVGEAT